MQEFIKELEEQKRDPELIEVIRQCAEPVMVSSLAHNMAGKPVSAYSSEEKNIYQALIKFSDGIEEDLKLLGSFEQVEAFFRELSRKRKRFWN